MAFSFSDQETRTLSSVLDEIIPPSTDGNLPGAGEVGLVDFIADAVEKSPELRPAIMEGISALGDFTGLAKDEKTRALNELATTAPAFLPGLTFQTYLGYYQHPRVLEGLGLPPRPPHPEGYELETGDLGLLNPVRARPNLYRE